MSRLPAGFVLESKLPAKRPVKAAALPKGFILEKSPAVPTAPTVESGDLAMMGATFGPPVPSAATRIPMALPMPTASLPTVQVPTEAMAAEAAKLGMVSVAGGAYVAPEGFTPTIRGVGPEEAARRPPPQGLGPSEVGLHEGAMAIFKYWGGRAAGMVAAPLTALLTRAIGEDYRPGDYQRRLYARLARDLNRSGWEKLQLEGGFRKLGEAEAAAEPTIARLAGGAVEVIGSIPWVAAMTSGVPTEGLSWWQALMREGGVFAVAEYASGRAEGQTGEEAAKQGIRGAAGYVLIGAALRGGARLGVRAWEALDQWRAFRQAARGLGVSPNASAGDIASAFRARLKAVHPDLHPDLAKVDPLAVQRLGGYRDLLMWRVAGRAGRPGPMETSAPLTARLEAAPMAPAEAPATAPAVPPAEVVEPAIRRGIVPPGAAGAVQPAAEAAPEAVAALEKALPRAETAKAAGAIAEAIAEIRVAKAEYPGRTDAELEAMGRERPSITPKRVVTPVETPEPVPVSPPPAPAGVTGAEAVPQKPVEKRAESAQARNPRQSWYEVQKSVLGEDVAADAMALQDRLVSEWAKLNKRKAEDFWAGWAFRGPHVAAGEPRAAQAGAAGARGRYDRAGRVVTLMKVGDATTAMHEFWHMLEDTPGMFLAEERTVLDRVAEKLAPGKLAPARRLNPDATLADAGREALAELWEQYHYRGRVPASVGNIKVARAGVVGTLRQVFHRISRLFRRVYGDLRTRVPDKVRQVFDRMYGNRMSLQDIVLARQARQQAIRLERDLLNAYEKMTGGIGMEMEAAGAGDVGGEQVAASEGFTASFAGRFPGEITDWLNHLPFAERMRYVRGGLRQNVPGGMAEGFIAGLPGGYGEFRERLDEIAGGRREATRRAVAWLEQNAPDANVRAKIEAYRQVEGGEQPLGNLDRWLAQRTTELAQGPVEEFGAHGRQPVLPGLEQEDAVAFARALTQAEKDKTVRAAMRQVFRAGRLETSATIQDMREVAAVLPAEARAKVLTALARVTGRKAGVKAFARRVNTVLDQWQHREAVADFKKAMPTEAQIAKLRPIYRDKLRELSQGLDLAKMRPRTRRTLESMARFLEERAGSGFMQGVPPGVLARMQERVRRLARRPLAGMPADEIRELTRLVQLYSSQSELASHLYDEREGRTTEQRIEAVRAEVLGKPKSLLARAEQAEHPLPILNRLWQWTIRFGHRGQLDGERGAKRLGPTMHRLLYLDPLLEGMSPMAEMIHRGEMGLKDRLELAGYNWGTRELWGLGDYAAGKGLGQQVELTLLSGRKVKMTVAEAATALAHLEQPYVLDQIAEQRVAFTPDSARIDDKPFLLHYREAGNLRQQVPQAQALMESIRATMADQKAGLNAASLRYDGYEKFTEADYWRVRTSSIDRTIIEEAPIEAWAMMLPENLAFTKERTGQSNVIVLEDCFRAFYEHNHGAAAYVAMTPHVRNIRAVIGDPGVAQAIQSRWGVAGLSSDRRRGWIPRMIQAMTTLASAPPTEIEQVGRKVIHNVARAKLAANPSPILKQVAGAMSLLTELDDNPAMAWYWLLRYGIRAARSPAMWEAAFDAAPLLRDRFEGMTTRFVSTEMGEGAPVLGRSRALDVGMRGFNYADSANSVIAFGATLGKLLETRPEMSEQARLAEAGRQATLIVSRTQNATNPLDASDLARQSRGSALLSAWLLFKSETNKQRNILVEATDRYAESNRGPMAKLKLVHDAVIVTLIRAAWVAGVSTIISLLYRLPWRIVRPEAEERRDDELGNRFAWNLVQTIAGMQYGLDDSLYEAQRMVRAAGKSQGPPEGAPGAVGGSVDFLTKGAYRLYQAAAAGDARFKTGPRRGASKRFEYGMQGAEEFSRGIADLLGLPEIAVRMGFGLGRVAGGASPAPPAAQVQGSSLRPVRSGRGVRKPTGRR